MPIFMDTNQIFKGVNTGAVMNCCAALIEHQLPIVDSRLLRLTSLSQGIERHHPRRLRVVHPAEYAWTIGCSPFVLVVESPNRRTFHGSRSGLGSRAIASSAPCGICWSDGS